MHAIAELDAVAGDGTAERLAEGSGRVDPMTLLGGAEEAGQDEGEEETRRELVHSQGPGGRENAERAWRPPPRTGAKPAVARLVNAVTPPPIDLSRPRVPSLLGEETISFAGFVPRSGRWGVSLTRPRYNVRVNWNHRGLARNNRVNGVSIEPGTFNWTSKRLYVDVVGEVLLRGQISLFYNFRNIGDATEDVKIYGPSTGSVARFRQRVDYASLWTVGLKGTF